MRSERYIELMSEPNPDDPRDDAWKILSSTYLVQDRWLRLRADHCETAAGETVAPYYVFEYPDWVTVVALTPERHVVLIRQYRHGIRRTILEIPGGAVDPGDASLLATAQRELLEETGYAATEWRHAGTAGASPHNHTNLIHCFIALGAHSVAAPRRESSEQMETLLMLFDEFVERAYQGELEHAHHVASLFFALRALKKA